MLLKSIIKIICFFVVFFKNLVISICKTFDHSVIVLGFLWHGSSFASLLFSFDIFPFLNAVWYMNSNAMSAESLTANIAHYVPWPVRERRWAFFFTKNSFFVNNYIFGRKTHILVLFCACRPDLRTFSVMQ